METNLPRIKDFFAGRCILLTGGTGFIGMALIEGLLGAGPDLGRIYVLVREKRGLSPQERITKLLSSEIFKHYSDEVKAKVVPVVGEITAENLGLKPEVLEEIKENVTIVIHIAGFIKFNRTLLESVNINVRGTLRCIELTKTLKHLSAFIYFSTAFVNSNLQEKIKEEVYKTKMSPREMIRLALETPSTIDHQVKIKSDVIEGHQNPYTYSKQLAENLILEDMEGLPVGILRPSSVFGFYKHEIPGWMGNSKTSHCGFIRGMMKGIARCVPGNPQGISFSCPCDHVVSATLALTVALGTLSSPPKQPKVVHVSNSVDVNPLTVESYVNILNEEVWKNPCDSYPFLPRCKIRNGLRLDFFLLIYLIFALCFYIPERIFKLTSPRLRGIVMFNIQWRGRKYFAGMNSCITDLAIENSIQLSGNLHPDDVEKYSFDPVVVDFRKLFAGNISWLRQYYFKDSNSVTWMHRVVQRCYQLMEFFIYITIFIVLTTIVFLISQSWIISLSLGLLVTYFIIWV